MLHWRGGLVLHASQIGLCSGWLRTYGWRKSDGGRGDQARCSQGRIACARSACKRQAATSLLPACFRAMVRWRAGLISGSNSHPLRPARSCSFRDIRIWWMFAWVGEARWFLGGRLLARRVRRSWLGHGRASEAVGGRLFLRVLPSRIRQVLCDAGGVVDWPQLRAVPGVDA